MAFIMGFAGAAVVLGLLGAGIFLGWRLAKGQLPPAAEAPTERESQRLREEQEAFQLLQNYTVERAYGGREA